VQILEIAVLDSMATAKGQVSGPHPAAATGERDSVRYPGPLFLFALGTLVGSLSFARFYTYTGPSAGGLRQLVGNWLIFLSCYYAWVALAPLAFRLERRFPLNRGQLLRSLLILIPMNVPFSLAALLLFNILSHAARIFMPAPNVALTTFEPRELLVHVCFFWASIAAGRFVRYQSKLQEGQRAATQLALEKSKLETSLKEAELEVLRMRLNPHFLFNTLQNISVLVHQDPKIANQMLVRLGDLMRAAFRREYTSEVTLASELELTRAYLEIEQLRFADRLSVTIDVETAVENALVPTLLLQPLVENAIKHGLNGIAKQGNIVILGAERGCQLALIVRDDGAGFSKQAVNGHEMGIGLGSTYERLSRMYPNQHELAVKNLPEGGTEIAIKIPLHLQAVEVGAQNA
jgi:two-component system, LytTR family, sensor kinase